jgi:mono/diheme cytochrome c family protein
MKAALHVFVLSLCLLGVAAGLSIWYIFSVGLSARDEPTAIEHFVAGGIRRVVVTRSARGLRNPVAPSREVLADARAHYADHCATCHANDGSGKTEMGRGLFPRAPDMRLAATQSLSDGELFWIIENGIKFTGMPAWSTGTAHGAQDSWKLVHFIRHLPTLSADEIKEMEGMNPRSPEEIRQELEEQRFLEGADVAPATPQHEHGGKHD